MCEIDRSTEPERTDLLFHALSDATRRDIVRLVLHGEHSVSDLARRYPMSFAAVQKHVAVLERADLITKHQRGRERIVRGRIDAVRDVNRLLDRARGHLARPYTAIRRRPRRTRRRRTTMAVTDVHKDPTELTMTIASEWDAPIARVWQLWADPRKLERWWGPPTYPATVVEHELRPVARSATS